MKSASDSELLEYATQNGYALLSMDDDVARLNAEWVKAGKHHGGIFYRRWSSSKDSRVGPMVRECATLAELIEGGVGTLADDIHDQLHYIKK
jgi:hypothetical protein